MSSFYKGKLNWVPSTQLDLLNLRQGVVPCLVIEVAWQGSNCTVGTGRWVLSTYTNVWSSTREMATKLAGRFAVCINVFQQNLHLRAAPFFDSDCIIFTIALVRANSTNPKCVDKKIKDLPSTVWVTLGSCFTDREAGRKELQTTISKCKKMSMNELTRACRPRIRFCSVTYFFCQAIRARTSSPVSSPWARLEVRSFLIVSTR
jgi:hypothetical protein